MIESQIVNLDMEESAMPFENDISKPNHSIGSPVDLVAGIFQGAIQRPWNGIAQLTHLPEMHITGEAQSTLGRVGETAGSFADFFGLYKAADSAASSAARRGLFKSADMPFTKGLMVGGIYNGVMQPDLSLSDRMKQGVTWGLLLGGTNKAATAFINRAAARAAASADAADSVASMSESSTSSLHYAPVDTMRTSR